MQQVKYTPISLLEKLLNTGLATGQKNYALARQRAEQFNSKPAIETPDMPSIANDVCFTAASNFYLRPNNSQWSSSCK